jgi:cytochrome d ubiquinol oxidase subunit II
VGRRSGWAFVFTGLTVALAVISCFAIMFPRVMISSTDAANSLTIYTAASGPYTLKVMTIVALIFVPVVLVYQGWTYWVFRKRVKVKAEELVY